jgi:hypothetical protein
MSVQISSTSAAPPPSQFIQSNTGWNQRHLGLSDLRRLALVALLHRLSLQLLSALGEGVDPPSWIANLKIPSRLRMSAPAALSLSFIESPDQVEAKLLDEKRPESCMLRLHELAWKVHQKVIEASSKMQDPSLLQKRAIEAGCAGATHWLQIHRSSQPITRPQELIHALNAFDLWIGVHPLSMRPLSGYFLTRRILPDVGQVDLIQPPAPAENRQDPLLRDLQEEIHLAWLGGWVQGLSAGRAVLIDTQKKNSLNSRRLEIRINTETGA